MTASPMSDARSKVESPSTDRPGAGALLVEQIGEAGRKRAKRKDIRPLARLLPYLLQQKVDAAIVIFWLLLSTAASLGLTVTARGAIDNGFENGGRQLDLWFLVLGANALFLGLATAMRFFYVTKTGERILSLIHISEPTRPY